MGSGKRFLFALISLVSWIILVTTFILVWFKRSLHSAKVNRKGRHRPLKLTIVQAVLQESWIGTSSSGEIMGEGQRGADGGTGRQGARVGSLLVLVLGE